MKNYFLSFKDTHKLRVGLFTVCMMIFSVIITTSGCVTKIESFEVLEQSSEFNKFDYNSFEDFIEPLERLGLMNVPFTSENPLLYSNGEPHLVRISQDQPILISSEDDVDVLLALTKFVIEQNLDGISWETCVDDALIEAGLYDYWSSGFRELTRPAREQQITDMATNYTLEELMVIFYNSPGLLEEFQELGFFQDVVLDDSNAGNK